MREVSDLYIRIGRRKSPHGPFPFLARFDDGREFRTHLDQTAFGRSIEAVASTIRDALHRSEAWVWSSGPLPAGDLLLHIADPELLTYPFERLKNSRDFSTLRNIIRFTPRPQMSLGEPLSLPIDVLVADLDPDRGPVLPDLPALNYFASTKVTDARADSIARLLKTLPFDIVHLVSDSRWVDDEGVLHPRRGPEVVRARALAKSLRHSGTRLLIIDGVRGRAPVLDFAHRLQNAGGPPCLVIGSHPDSFHALERLYRSVIHNEPLALPTDVLPSSHFSFFNRPGGENLLRLSKTRARIQNRVEANLKRARDARSILAKEADRLDREEEEEEIEELRDPVPADPGWTHPLGYRIAQLDSVIKNLQSTRETQYDFSQETGGLVPMNQQTRALEETEAKLAEAERGTARVVNTWFQKRDRELDKKETLAAGGRYELRLQIGIAIRKSIVKNPRGIPEEALERARSRDGLELHVVVSSADFEIAHGEWSLKLPPAPQESQEVGFDLRAPDRPVRARLRANVYYKRNLLQSLSVNAEVTREEDFRRTEQQEATVDFALTGAFADIDCLPEPTVSFATNQDGSTHNFYVHGKGIDRRFDLTGLKEGVKEARSVLQDVCSGPNRKRPRYPFKNNRGTEKQLVGFLPALAQIGWLLYTDFVTGEDEAFETKLKQALGKRATIQVAITDKASYVFPWAMVYDKLLVQGDDNTVCPTFLEDLELGTPLESQACMVDGCAHEETSVVCPSAFWGFRHVIEQPLSVHESESGPATNLTLTIESSEAMTSMVGFSEKLNDLKEHASELGQIAGFQTSIRRSKTAIGTGLQRQDMALVYFYCHGGRQRSRVWLGIGKKNEKLVPADLHAWHIKWPTVHPLVFINGCETVAITPDDLLPFNRLLARSGAAGVIGTEIKIPEQFARRFGKDFLSDFIDHQPVGEVIRKQRLRLLQDYNPLGLVYTPYCSARLSLSGKLEGGEPWSS